MLFALSPFFFVYLKSRLILTISLPDHTYFIRRGIVGEIPSIRMDIHKRLVIKLIKLDGTFLIVILSLKILSLHDHLRKLSYMHYRYVKMADVNLQIIV